MQLSYQKFNQIIEQIPEITQMWQVNENEPVFIVNDEKTSHVVLSYALYQQLLQKNSNADKLGMSLVDLAKIDDDFEFERPITASKEIEL